MTTNETNKACRNPDLAAISRLSLNITWALFFITLCWIAVASNIHTDSLAAGMLTILPVAFVVVFCIHLLTLALLIIRCEHLFHSFESIYFALSDIFFLLLIDFV